MLKRDLIASAKDIPPRKELPMGGVVGQMTVKSVLRPFCEQYPEDVDPRWHMREQFGYILTEVSEIPFFPALGMLGFFPLEYP